MFSFLNTWVLLSKVGILLRIIAAYTFVALLVPLFFTESRAGWLGAILSLCLRFIICVEKK